MERVCSMGDVEGGAHKGNGRGHVIVEIWKVQWRGYVQGVIWNVVPV